MVFIHGIGSQEPGETLLDWSAPIVRTIREWHEQRGIRIDPVRRTQIDFQSSTIPTVQLSIPPSVTAAGNHPPQEWLLTEAWWAKEVDPPSVGLILDWLFGPQKEFGRIINGIWDGLEASGETGRWVAVERVLLRLFVPLASIVAPLIYGLTSLLRLIPIPPLQDGIARRQLDWFLGDWFGDVRILVADRVQAANVRAKVAKTVRALHNLGCERIVIVGHSGGTIVSYMTLADPLYIPGEGDPQLEIRVDRLITHGQAVELAWLMGGGVEATQIPTVPAIGDAQLGLGDNLMKSLESGRPNLEWIDFWATHDPAPAGPLGGTDETPSFSVSRPGTSHPVRNRMSIVNDHGTYWENDEQFVLPVVRLIETTGSPADSRFYPTADPDVRSERRRERVRSLAEWWSGLLVSGLALLAIAVVWEWMGNLALTRLGDSMVETIRVLTNLGAVADLYDGFPIDWIGPIAALIPGPSLDVASYAGALPSWVLGVLGLVVTIWLAGKPTLRRWNDWDAAARQAARSDGAPLVASQGFTMLVPFTIGTLLVLIVVLASSALFGPWSIF